MGIARQAASLMLMSWLAHANASSTDTLLANAQSVSFGGAAPEGLAANVDWLRQDPNHWLIGLGITREDFGGARLSIARVTGGVNWIPAAGITAIAEAGPALEGASHYTFLRQTLEGRATVSKTLQIAVGGQYVEANAARTVLMRGGVQWTVRNNVALGAQSVIELGPVSYETYTEGFVGVSVPVSRCLVGLSWDVLNLSTVIRRTTSLTLAVPLQRGV